MGVCGWGYEEGRIWDTQDCFGTLFMTHDRSKSMALEVQWASEMMGLQQVSTVQGRTRIQKCSGFLGFDQTISTIENFN